MELINNRIKTDKECEVYAIGDLHGNFGPMNDFISTLNESKDYIFLQCGDWGYFPGYVKFQKLRLKNNMMMFWCPGNHEHWDKLEKLGLEITELLPNLFYCPFGTSITLPTDDKVLFVGGADSIDKAARIEGVSWFRQEIITYAEINRLNEDEQYDIIISHTAPEYFNLDLGPIPGYKDCSCDALNLVHDFYNPKLWIFGHFHQYMKGRYKNTNWYGLSENRDSRDKWIKRII